MFHNNRGLYYFVFIIFIPSFIHPPFSNTSFLTSISFIASIFNNNLIFLSFLSLFIISSHLIICITNIPYYNISSIHINPLFYHPSFRMLLKSQIPNSINSFSITITIILNFLPSSFLSFSKIDPRSFFVKHNIYHF